MLVAVALAGCATTPFPVGPASAQAEPEAFLAGATPLWDDPQNAPHPLWNWPTLTHPAVGDGVPAWWAPIPAAPLPDAVTGLQHVKRAQGVASGAGIALFGSLAVVPGFSSTSYIVDLSTPTNPVKLSEFSPVTSAHRGAVVIAYPTGQLVAVFSTDSALEAWDITDPTQPEWISSVRPPGGSHKVGVVPGTPIVYNANSEGAGSVMTIYDYTAPATPVKVLDFDGGFGCHHVYFWIRAAEEKYRALCAGLESTQLLDIADPRAPEIIVDVPVHHGIPGTPSTAVVPARFSHFAILSQDGDTLIVGDETGGGIAPGCDVHAQALGLSVSGVAGNVYFYDVADETRPQLKGWFNPGAHYAANPAIPGTCTAHHGRIVPDPAGARDLLVMGFYSAGVVLVDFTDPASPQQVAQWARGTTWESWYANGWIVTGDLSRGLDVLRLT